MERRVASSIALAFFLISIFGCSVSKPVTAKKLDGAGIRAQKPEWQVGDEWTYRVVGTGYPWSERVRDGALQVWRVDRREVVDGEPVYVVKRANPEKGLVAEEMYAAKDLNPKKMILGPERVFTPPMQMFPWPLETGKRWQVDCMCRIGTNVFEVRGPAWVEGYEEVTVPAGTFKAFKVVATSSTKEFTYWYAPEVKWVIEVTKS